MGVLTRGSPGHLDPPPGPATADAAVEESVHPQGGIVSNHLSW